MIPAPATQACWRLSDGPRAPGPAKGRRPLAKACGLLGAIPPAIPWVSAQTPVNDLPLGELAFLHKAMLGGSPFQGNRQKEGKLTRFEGGGPGSHCLSGQTQFSMVTEYPKRD